MTQCNRTGLSAALIAAVSIAAGSSGFAAPPPEQVSDPDTRMVLSLPPDERHLVLTEMRSFVIAIQQITDGLARGDSEQVAEAARRMGSGAANEIPPHVVAKLPEPFKQLAGRVHTTFDRIALDAADFGDTQHTLVQVSELIQHCIACHGMYQIEKEKFPPLKGDLDDERRRIAYGGGR